MANPGRPSYRLNLNRNPTQKWAEAKHVDYDGDDWGEDDYDDYNAPQSGPAHAGYQQQQSGWGPGPGNATQRSFTNPVLAPSTGRTSFDRDEERRHFSGGAFDPRHQAQPHQNFESASRGHTGVPPLHIQTQMSGAPSQSSAQPRFQNNQQTDMHGVPYSAPVAHTSQRFNAGTRPEHEEPRGYNEFQLAQPDNLREKQSRMPSDRPVMTQQQIVSPINHPRQPDTVSATNVPAENKPLPFIRPADIYKRLEEEREKERRSQESSRPSIDSTSGGVRESSLPADKAPQPKFVSSQPRESDSGERIEPSLDAAAGRESKHGISGISQSNISPDRTEQPASAMSTSLQEQQNPGILSRAASSANPDPLGAASGLNTGYVHLASSPTSGPVPALESFQRVLNQKLPMAAKSSIDGRPADATDGEDLPNFEPEFSSGDPTHASKNDAIRPSDQASTSSIESQSSGDLQHQPSLGYKSAVQQAFEAENDNMLSPSNTSDTMPRSNSTSTSGISPIISRRSVHGRDPSSDLMSRSQAIPEEPASLHARNESTATVRASVAPADTSVLPATTFQPGYRREKSPASTEEGAARRPLSVQIPDIPEAQQGVVSTTTSSNSTAQNATPVMLPSSRYTPDTSEQETPTQQDVHSDVAPTPASRTASEDWQEWQAQRQQVHAKHGIPDSDTASPAISSMSRSESPVKGTVRDIAERLESNSGRSSPASLSVPENRTGLPPKVTHLRNEKFRPTLPGGWMSDTTTASSVDYGESPEVIATPTMPTSLDRQESTDSIPTARPPKNWQSSRSEPRNAAFAAAAAAGSAMAGAFSGSSFSHGGRRHSESTSEEESDHEADAPPPPKNSDTRDFAASSFNGPAVKTTTESGNQETPRQINQQYNNTGHRESDDPIRFPAPLRTNKTGETKQSSPRLSMPPVAASQENHDPDQLQQEIVKSLTPKSSSVAEAKTTEPDRLPASTDVIHQSSRPISVVSSDDDILPQEYSSYWDEPPVKTTLGPQKSQNSAKVMTSESTNPPVVQAPTVQQEPVISERPQPLGHRYSWETGPEEEQARGPASIMSPSSRDLKSAKPSTPPQPQILSSLGINTPPNPVVSEFNDQSINSTPKETTMTAVNLPSTIQNGNSFPHERTNFRNILAFQDSTQRIRGFDENRQIFAQSTGLLENWLLSMRTPEHTDVFQSSRLPPVRTTPGQESSLASPPRPLPTTGTKQMQEDGKRLLAAAGKYSGKAGIAAKGLFARGKDKLRTASASDKVSITSRRRSSTFEREPSSAPSPQPTAQPTSAPQIPAPALDTPPGEPSWGILSTKIDQMFLDRTSQPVVDSSQKNLMPASTSNQPIRGQDVTTHPADALEPARHDRPPPSVLAAIPGTENKTKAPSTQQLPNFGLATGSSKDTPMSKTHRNVGHPESNEEQLESSAKSTTSTTVGQEKPWNLPVPRERRPSSISDVSDISHAPDDRGETHPRNVSPTLETQPKPQQMPSISTQIPAKEVEARQEHGGSSEGTLPPYSSVGHSAVQQKPNQIAPGALIVPIANLSNVDSMDNSQAGSRPFSFFGSETLNHMQSSQRDSRVVVSDIPQGFKQGEESNIDIQKTPQPNITEHPAFRENDDDSATPEMQQPNPLPSSRRSQQEIEQYRQRQSPPQPQSNRADEGYRIPGPYVQEYRSPRSPKPMFNQEFPNTQHEPMENRAVVPNPVDPQYRGQPPVQSTFAPSAIEQRPEYNRNKSRTFGSLFRTRSKSQTRNNGRDSFTGPAPSGEYYVDENKKRRGLFGFGNRDTSPVRQSNEANKDMYGPDAYRGRTTSMDVLKPSASGSRIPTDNKKKRSSGIGAFFSKAGGKDRESGRLERNASAPLAWGPSQSHGNYSQHPPQQQQQQHYQYQGQPHPQPHPDSAANSNRGYYPASPDPITQFPQPPETNSNNIGKAETAYQETQAYYATTENHPDHRQAGPGNRHDTTAVPQIYSNAPNNVIAAVLSPSHQRHQDAPQEQHPRSTSQSPPVPVTRANKDISHGQDRPYVPPTSPRPQVVPSTIEAKPAIADHVKQLHKRSRSPRLGRPPSEEFINHTDIDPTRSGSTTQRLKPDPATQLGMFNSKKISPQGGVPREPHEQESPWTIVLPTDAEEQVNKNLHPRDRNIGPVRSQPSKAVTGADFVSPATSHQHNHGDVLGNVISPVMAVEPRVQEGLPAAPRSHGSRQQRQSLDLYGQNENRRDRITQQSKVGTDHVPTDTAAAATVPPTASNASVIPRPGPESVPTQQEVRETASPTTSGEEVNFPSSRAASRLNNARVEQSPNTVEARSSDTSRPLTVAERILGVQPTVRDTVPEHRSTTPVPRSPAPPIESQPKVSTWPDANPSTAAVTTSNVGGTTVTTTTMKAGSKLGKGSIKTNTYVIDTNDLSRSNSNTTNSHTKGQRDSTRNPASPSTAAAVQQTPVNTTPAVQSPYEPQVSGNSSQPPRSYGKSINAFELPGSKPDGYESEEEIVMSATAYPGQEWMPSLIPGASWDD